ncbi:hypothetical protein FSP39_021708 [Pinctada imbricata]|uniref:TNF receptor-associated factor 3 n=1 Tax=Pinctada imbricata TaxID=66713 RepID=A0AA88XXN5_PINIB|nr:hypothetical protein FSP39_021708 [Pinctada imbricata]
MSSVADSGIGSMQKLSVLSSMESSMRSPNDIHVPEFIDLPKGYVCIICASVLRNAMQLPCGHLLCETPCVDVLFDNKEEATCPIREEDCLEPFKKREVFKDVCTRKEVLLLKVYCPYRKQGCKEKFPWRVLNKHVAECQFRLVPCPNEGCNEQISANQLEEHRLKMCLYRPVICEYCGQTIPECELKKHYLDVCEKIPIPCPNKCGIGKLPRSEMTEHIKVCPMAPRSCAYKSIGCKFEGLEKEVSEHEQKATDIHLKLVIQFTHETSDRNQRLVQEMETIKEERDRLKKAIDDMHETNRKMKEEVDMFNKDFTKELKRKMVALTERVIKLERSIGNLPKRDLVERQERELSSLKEDQTQFQERVNRLERAGPIGGAGSEAPASGEVMVKTAQNERQLAIQDVKLAELDLRFQVLETANYEGVLMWKIRDYTRRKQEAVAGRTVSLYSQPFYTSRYGYKMCARVYLNGDGMGKGTHLSLFFVVMRGEYDALLQWPFQHRVTLMLLDQQDGRRHVHDSFQPDPTSSSFVRPTSEMNIATGCPLFVAHAVMETDTYKRDDTIFIKIKVTENTDRTSVVSDKLANMR